MIITVSLLDVLASSPRKVFRYDITLINIFIIINVQNINFFFDVTTLCDDPVVTPFITDNTFIPWLILYAIHNSKFHIAWLYIAFSGIVPWASYTRCQISTANTYQVQVISATFQQTSFLKKTNYSHTKLLVMFVRCEFYTK